MYKRQPTHLAPEATRFNPQGAQGSDMRLCSTELCGENSAVFCLLAPLKHTFFVGVKPNF